MELLVRLILCRDGLFIAGMWPSVVNLKLGNTFLVPSEWCMTELEPGTSAECSIGEKSRLAIALLPVFPTLASSVRCPSSPPLSLPFCFILLAMLSHCYSSSSPLFRSSFSTLLAVSIAIPRVSPKFTASLQKLVVSAPSFSLAPALRVTIPIT